MTKYILKVWAGYTIEPIEVISETEKTVTMLGFNGKPCKKNKANSHEFILNTWNGAYQKALAICRQKVSNAQSALDYANSRLAMVEAMTKPDSETDAVTEGLV